MAPSSSPDSPQNHFSYDVFLSFCVDTRHSFTDHLYKELLRAGFRAFRDNDDINGGEELKAKVETTIVESRASVVVFSEYYVEFGGCLDELCFILEQRRKCGHKIIPIYYHVDPSDVRNQRGSFAIDESKSTVDDVNRWKAALTLAGNLTGMVLSGSEARFIEQVVDAVSSSLPNRMYDIFLSFRGVDTRYTFTDHLYQALLRAGLHTFMDNDGIRRGQKLRPEIDNAIMESRAFIVVLSEDFANSRWCLNELCLIMEQRRKCNHFVLPIYYHVEQSDVMDQRGSFNIDGSDWPADDERRWKAALIEVASLKGMVLSGSEVNFIAEAIDNIKRELGHL